MHYLTVPEVSACARVNRAWRKAASSNLVWNRLLIRDCPHINVQDYLSLDIDKSDEYFWRKQYQHFLGTLKAPKGP